MKRALLALMLMPASVLADDEFTPAQLEKIERLLERERVRIRQDLAAEFAERGGLPARAEEGKERIEEPGMPAHTGGAESDMVDPSLRSAGGLRSSAAPLDLGFASEDASVVAYKFQIEFDDKKATAAVGASGSSERYIDTSRRTFRQQTWELVLSRPITDSGEDAVDFATLDGLSSGLKLDFARTWRRSNLDKTLDFFASREFDALCDRLFPNDSDSCSLSMVENALGKDSAEFVSLERRHNRWILEHSLGLQVGYDTFGFITPQLGKGSESHVGYGAAFDTTFISPSRRWLFAIGAKYQRVRQSNDDVVLCPPGNGVDPVQCVSGSLGPPSEVTSKQVWGEVRGASRRFGYSLKVVHDLETDETGVVLPIYFVRNDDNELTGGLRLGWTSGEHFGAGIFVSKPFNP